MESCRIIPRVKNKKGELKDSILFKNLLTVAPNREAAKQAWFLSRSQKFKEEIVPYLESDINGEPLISEIIDKTDLAKKFNFNTIEKSLNKKIGYYQKGTEERAFWDKTPENKRMLYERARKFNTTSEFRENYVANVKIETDINGNQSYIIEVSKKNSELEKQAKDLEHEVVLNNKLKTILNEWGLDVGILDEADELLGIDGVADFDSPTKLANGLIQIIKIAKGEKGQKALPEEFAHVAIRLFKDNPLVQRMLNIVDNPKIIKEILGSNYATYEQKYNGDIELLAEEAAGQLLAKHLTGEIKVPEKPYKSILSRVIDFIKNFFSSKEEQFVEQALQDANKVYGEFAANLLNHKFEEIKLKNLQTKNKLYAVSTKVKSLKDVLQAMLNTEVKRYKIYNKKSKDKNFWKTQQTKITELRQAIEIGGENAAVLNYLEEAVTLVTQLNNRLDKIDIRGKSVSDLNAAGVFTLLRNIRNYFKSFSAINNTLLDFNSEHPGELSDDVLLQIKELGNCINFTSAKYDSIASYGFKEFLKHFLGDKIEIPFGKRKGEIIRIEDLIHTADHDISTVELWLDSMAEGTNYTLKVFDQAVKKAKDKARMATIEFQKIMIAAGIELEQAGVKDFEWMFEVDEKGNKTGNYISKTDWGSYTKARSAMYKDLEKKYGKNPKGDKLIAYNDAKKSWYLSNTIKRADGVRVPNSIYDSKVFAREMSNPAKKKFYDTAIKAKEKFDSYLPTSVTKTLSTIKIRKDLLERVKGKGIGGAGKQLWESLKDDFLSRSDDDEFGITTGIKDFEGRNVEQLPIYYTRLKKGESENDVSTDVVSTMIAYAAMANDYHAMNEVIDVLETGRDYMLDNFEPEIKKNGKSVMEKLEAFGEEVKSKITSSSGTSNTIKRLNKYFSMQVYGKYLEDSGNIGKTNINKQKAANQVNRITALNQLAFNTVAGITNVVTGVIMMNIEAAAGEYFKPKSIVKADKEYAKFLPSFVAEIGQRVQTNKLSLFNEMFNVMQEYESSVREINFDKKTILKRLGKSSTLFFMNNCGEHWMQHRTALSLAVEYKMKDKFGKECSLWDALEVKYINPNNKKLGAKLVIKDGYTKLDGTKFTQDDIYKFSRKSAAINFRLHGIYNKLDRNALQSLALGRMAIMYRKWIVPALNRRFRKQAYNLDLDSWEEGYYRTFLSFIGNTIKELKEGQFNLIANYKDLSEYEKKNIIRSATEISHFIAICVATAILNGLFGDEDLKHRPWAVRMLELILRREKTEIGSMTLSPLMLNEGLKILKSPAAGIDIIQNTIGLLGLINPFNYETFGGEDAIVDRGQWKDHNKATKIFMNSPFIPMQKTIYRTLHPEESLPFYQNSIV